MELNFNFMNIFDLNEEFFLKKKINPILKIFI